MVFLSFTHAWYDFLETPPLLLLFTPLEEVRKHYKD